MILALAAREANEDGQESTDQARRQGEIVTKSCDDQIGFWTRRFLQQRRKTRESPASKASVENMPRVVIGEDKEKDGSCAICLEEWSKDDVAAEMPCKHKFHSKCVEEWLGMHATCPMCRYEMPVEEVEEEKKVGFGLVSPLTAAREEVKKTEEEEGKVMTRTHEMKQRLRFRFRFGRRKLGIVLFSFSGIHFQFN